MGDYKLSDYHGDSLLETLIHHHMQSIPEQVMAGTTEVTDDHEEDRVLVRWQGVMRMNREEFASLINQATAGDFFERG